MPERRELRGVFRQRVDAEPESGSGGEKSGLDGVGEDGEGGYESGLSVSAVVGECGRGGVSRWVDGGGDAVRTMMGVGNFWYFRLNFFVTVLSAMPG